MSHFEAFKYRFDRNLGQTVESRGPWLQPHCHGWQSKPWTISYAMPTNEDWRAARYQPPAKRVPTRMPVEFFADIPNHRVSYSQVVPAGALSAPLLTTRVWARDGSIPGIGDCT